MACAAAAVSALVVPAVAGAGQQGDQVVEAAGGSSRLAGLLVDDCSPSGLAQRFAPWGDPAWYFPVPASSAWRTSGDATASGDGYRLGEGATATSPAQCIGLRSPTMRLLASSPDGGTLRVDVIGPLGLTLPVGYVVLSDSSAPTPVLPLVLNVLGPISSGGSADIRVRVVALGGTVDVDELWIDPWKRT